ncbi:hypothetical protein LBMAG52_36750 [Planctomycetia bacterium]|nr:hypothetical protein LBMAG52_36750 [Planctomycetia bacterium]
MDGKGKEWKGRDWNGRERKGVFFLQKEKPMDGQETYPIDTTDLHKGSVVTMARLIEITKANPGTSRYAFRLLRLKNFIAKALVRRGEPATCVIKQNEIVILTDAEANQYNFAFAGSGARRIRRSTIRHAVIDLSKLTPDERLDWDKKSARLAMMVNGLKVKALPSPEPHKRLE